MFESCSAYQNSPHILFLSHCVPNPPDKGDRIRAHHLLNHLAAEYRIHLVCFARSRPEMERALELRDRCASIYAELLPAAGLARAGARFALGDSLAFSFYGSRRLARRVAALARLPLAATVAYSSAMAQHAPAGPPLILDMVDVDSEKWLQYGSARRPGFLYRLEGERLRRLEIACAARAQCTFLATRAETALFSGVAPQARVETIENGVDFDHFDPSAVLPPERQEHGPVVFVGAMDYYPNADACRWFAGEVFPAVRRADPRREFVIVGRNPVRAVRRLARLDGVKVAGAVPDVRPYLAAAGAVVAPLRIARGIQNKVLEALAMGRRVLASSAVCEAFGHGPLPGLVRCDSPQDYVRAIATAGPEDPRIRPAALARFCWPTNLAALRAAVENAVGARLLTEVRAG